MATPSAQTALPITTTTPGDYDLGNNGPSCAGTVDVWDDEVEINVAKWPNPGDPTPGQEFEYDIRPCNGRGAAAGPVWLTDTLPLSTTFVSWSSDFGDTTYWTEVVTTGGQLVLYAPGLPSTCEDLHLRLLLDPDAPISTTLENTIVITAGGDVNPNDNQQTNTDGHVSGPRYDMNANKWYNSGVLVPGGWIRYGANYWNAGNTTIHAWMTDTLPPGTSYQPGSGQYHDGQPFEPLEVTDDYVVWDLGLVPVNDGFGFDFTLDISNTVTPPAVLTNCATVGITATEDTPWDNVSCVATTVYTAGQPNLYVTKEKRDNYEPGYGNISYRIHLGNYGDQTVYNVHITDTFPISTTYDGHGIHWDGSPFTDTVSATELLVVFERIEPGWSGEIKLGVGLDDPNARMRWYTNTVEIDTPSDDANPNDNSDTDVAFSGGEVDQVDLWVARAANVWGQAQPNVPITVTTALTQYTGWVDGGGNWDISNVEAINPGDTITVTAGSGIMPVVVHVPNPYTAYASSITDTVWGQIDDLDHEWVQVDLDDGPKQDVQTDGSGNYSATFGDIPRGGRGEVRYNTKFDYAQVGFRRGFQAPDLIMNVNYAHDWVNGYYESGHTVWLTLTKSNSTTIKATSQLTTGPVPEWGGQSGFQTHGEDWRPRNPDILPGDWVFGLLNSASYTSAVRVGAINGELDVDADTVSGTIHANWFTQMLNANCGVAEPGGPWYNFTVDPDGGTYFCDFSADWDLLPGQDVNVQYQEPDGDWVINVFREPQPYLRIQKWTNGDPAEGGNFVFNVQYWNDGGDSDYAENVFITDMLLGGMIYLTDTSGFAHTGSGSGPIVWDLDTVPGSSSGQFDVFVEITAIESDTVTNTVQITTSSLYNQSSPGERYAEWSGTVQGNDTWLGVNKHIRGANPAPGTNFVWAVNVCNDGSTASSEVIVTDTLPISTTLLEWWGQNPGWTEVLSTSDQLVVSYPSIQPYGWCSEVYLRFHLDEDAWINMPISNTATITASNDVAGGSTSTDWHEVHGPYSNLYVRKDWNQGQLVPGGA